jgi:hypothetical protein
MPLYIHYDAPFQTPMAPRGKPSDVSEKDLEQFNATFSDILMKMEEIE